MKVRIRSRALAVLCLLLLLSACSDASKQLAIAAKTNIELQKFAVQAEKDGLMTLTEAKVVIDATDRIGKLGLSAVAVVEKLKASDPASRTAALDAIGAIADEIGRLGPTLGIKSDSARRNVEGLLAAITVSLNSARVMIAAKG